MRRPSLPFEITRSVVRDWERVAIRPPISWHRLSWPSAFHVGTAGLLPGLVEALVPLGMPQVRYDSGGRHGSWISRIYAATFSPSTWARPSVINGVAVLVTHLAAIRYIFLPIGTV
jgi:hypothetical protein